MGENLNSSATKRLHIALAATSVAALALAVFAISLAGQISATPNLESSATNSVCSPGPAGSTGTTGATGASGKPGASGAPGASGKPGATGKPGASGAAGSPGPSGASGAPGKDGADGTNGTNGTNGANGSAGINGANGTNGTNGVDGVCTVVTLAPTAPGLGYYGSFYSKVTQTNLAATNKMSFDTTDVADGVSIVSGSRVTFAHAGTYNLAFSAQFDKTDSGQDTVDVWLSDANGPMSWTNTKVDNNNNNGKVVAAWNFFVTVTAGQYVELNWYSADNAMRVYAQAPDINPARPEIPSVILTVNQVH